MNFLDNSFFNSYRAKLAICKNNRRKEIQEEIDKENEEMFRRMGISKPFINTKQLDGDYEGEHKNIVKKLRRVDAEGTVVPVTFSKDDYTSLEEDLTEIPATLIDGVQ